MKLRDLFTILGRTTLWITFIEYLCTPNKNMHKTKLWCKESSIQTPEQGFGEGK